MSVITKTGVPVGTLMLRYAFLSPRLGEPLPDLVDSNGNQQHQSTRHVLIIRGYIQQYQAVIQRTEQYHADERSQQGAFPPHEAGSAEHDGCDYGELKSGRCLRTAGSQLSRTDQSGKRGEQAAECINNEQMLVDLDAGQACRFPT